MDVALHRRHDHLTVGAACAGLFPFDIRDQHRHGFFHDSRRFDDLRQEHLPGAEQIADHVHPVHERPFDHVERPLGIEPGLFGVREHELIDALHERVLQPFLDGKLAPFQIIAALDGAAALESLGDLEEPFGRILAARQNDVLDPFTQVSRDVLVNRQLPCIDDSHGQTRTNRVVQEYGMHRFAHRLVAAKRERHVADAAAHVHRRQPLLDCSGRLDEIQAVSIVFLDARGDRKNVRIENDVFRGEVQFLGQKLEGAFADCHFAMDRVCLAFFIECHDDHCRTVSQTQTCGLQEGLLAFFQTDGVDDRLALHAFQPRLEHGPV